MTLLDRLTEAIAGPTAVRKSQERGVERACSNISEQSEIVTSNAPESALEIDEPLVDPNRPLGSRRPREGRVTVSRPEVHRSQSERPQAKRPPFQQTEFPPDISAMELTPEQLKRTYSDTGQWNPDENPLPPLPVLTGLSKYRMSVTADKQWRVENAKQKLALLDDCLVPHVVNPMCGFTDEEWEAIKQEVLRRDSVISSESIHSDSSRGLPSGNYIYGGIRVSRGFLSSATSSPRSSFHGVQPLMRKDSLMSNLSFGEEIKNQLQPLAQECFSELGLRKPHPKQLNSITETDMRLARDLSGIKKPSRPCTFIVGVDIESALASDDDDEDNWFDMPPPEVNQPSLLTKALRESHTDQNKSDHIRARTTSDERNKARVAARKALDRSRTIRAPPKTQTFRRQSRNVTQTHQKKQSTDKRRDSAMIEALQSAEAGEEHDEDSEQDEPPADLLCTVMNDSIDNLVAVGLQDIATYKTNHPAANFTEAGQAGAIGVQEAPNQRRRRDRSSTAIYLDATRLQ